MLRQKQQKEQQQQQQQQQQRTSESGNEDDDGQCISSRHQQPQQHAQRTVSITPPLTPRAVSDWVTVKDEPRAHPSASSSSSSSLSSLDAPSRSGGGSCGYGVQWYRQPRPPSDWIYDRYWSTVDGGLCQWSRGGYPCPVNELDVLRGPGYQSYRDWDTGARGSADYPSVVQSSALWYQHCHSPLYT